MRIPEQAIVLWAKTPKYSYYECGWRMYRVAGSDVFLLEKGTSTESKWVKVGELRGRTHKQAISFIDNGEG